MNKQIAVLSLATCLLISGAGNYRTRKEVCKLKQEKDVSVHTVMNAKKDMQKYKVLYESEKVKVEELEKEVHKVKEQQQVSRSATRDTKQLIGVFEATAYDDSVESQGKWVGQTATGMKPQRGVVAVDPKVIPLGTKLYIEGYGNAIAGDTGGAIKGHRVDLFMETKEECYSFGRRNVKVYKR